MLLKRLCDCGFDENATRWFGSYRTGRQQYVTYQNAQSVLEYITTGVPQGSVLGPTLFYLYDYSQLHGVLPQPRTQVLISALRRAPAPLRKYPGTGWSRVTKF